MPKKKPGVEAACREKGEEACGEKGEEACREKGGLGSRQSVVCKNIAICTPGKILGDLSCRYVFCWMEYEHFRIGGNVDVEAIIVDEMDYPLLNQIDSAKNPLVEGDFKWFGYPDEYMEWMHPLAEFLRDLPAKHENSYGTKWSAFFRAYRSVFELDYEGEILKQG